MSNNLDKQTPGSMIKAAREAKQINLNEVAQKLLLSKQTILAIEGDDYTEIPAQVYAEGYLKAYSKLLQIPVDLLLASFRNLNAYSNDVYEDRSEVADQTKNDLINIVKDLLKDKRKRFVLIGISVGLVLVLVLLLSMQFKLFSSKTTDATKLPNISSAMVETSKELISEEIGLPVVTISVANDAAEFDVVNDRRG